MKKLIFILIMTLCLSFTACNDNYNTESRNVVSESYSYSIIKVKVDNHDYIVAKNNNGYGEGISIIHSESCPCKKTNIYKKGE